MMRRSLALLLLLCGCAAPAPEPQPLPPPPAPQEPAIGTARVSASVLNVRRAASMEAEIVAQVKEGESVAILEDGEGWKRVRLASGEAGWVAERFLEGGGQSGCESDYAFLKAPTPAFSERGAHGLIVVEAEVNARGDVTSTKTVSNSTGDPALATLAEKEIRAAKFAPPIRNCVTESFFFTYRRTF